MSHPVTSQHTGSCLGKLVYAAPHVANRGAAFDMQAAWPTFLSVVDGVDAEFLFGWHQFEDARLEVFGVVESADFLGIFRFDAEADDFVLEFDQGDALSDADGDDVFAVGETACDGTAHAVSRVGFADVFLCDANFEWGFRIDDGFASETTRLS